MIGTPSLSVFLFAAALTVASGPLARAAEEKQDVKLDRQVRIPEGVLQPGEYTFAVEDRLPDRAILRITNLNREDSKNHFLVLTTANRTLKSDGREGLIFFKPDDAGVRILRGWVCPGCSMALEIVYSKDEAVEIMDTSAQPVMAADPTYDKLPKHLSVDDMKVVTLWLLSPKRITPEGRSEGVVAKKYTNGAGIADVATSSAEVPRSDRRLPRTGTNSASLLFLGLLLIAGAAGVHFIGNSHHASK